MDFRDYIFGNVNNSSENNDSTSLLADPSSLQYGLESIQSFSDSIMPDFGSVLGDEDLFGFNNLSLADLGGSDHLLSSSDSAFDASRELQSIFQLKEKPSLLPSLSFLKSVTPASALSSCYGIASYVEMGDGVLVMDALDGEFVNDGGKGLGGRRPSSLISGVGKKREISPGSHRSRRFLGAVGSSMSSGRGKHSGGGNSRSDGCSWKKDDTTQKLKHKLGRLEKEPHWNNHLHEQPINLERLPPTQIFPPDLWSNSYTNYAEGFITGNATQIGEQSWPPEIPLFGPRQTSVRGSSLYPPHRIYRSQPPPAGHTSPTRPQQVPINTPIGSSHSAAVQEVSPTGPPKGLAPKEPQTPQGQDRIGSEVRRRDMNITMQPLIRDEMSPSQSEAAQFWSKFRSFKGTTQSGARQSQQQSSPAEPCISETKLGTNPQAEQPPIHGTPPGDRLPSTPQTPPVVRQGSRKSSAEIRNRDREIWAHRSDELPPLRTSVLDYSPTEEERFANRVMHGPSTRRRLPVLECICPSDNTKGKGVDKFEGK